jgi:hypothetical protein
MLTTKQQDDTKNWIDLNKSKFPDTLDGETKYYDNVLNMAEMSVLQLFSSDEATQMHAYSKLRQLARDLQVKENWNKPLKRIEDINQ